MANIQFTIKGNQGTQPQVNFNFRFSLGFFFLFVALTSHAITPHTIHSAFLPATLFPCAFNRRSFASVFLSPGPPLLIPSLLCYCSLITISHFNIIIGKDISRLIGNKLSIFISLFLIYSRCAQGVLIFSLPLSIRSHISHSSPRLPVLGFPHVPCI